MESPQSFAMLSIAKCINLFGVFVLLVYDPCISSFAHQVVRFSVMRRTDEEYPNDSSKSLKNRIILSFQLSVSENENPHGLDIDNDICWNLELYVNERNFRVTKGWIHVCKIRKCKRFFEFRRVFFFGSWRKGLKRFFEEQSPLHARFELG